MLKITIPATLPGLNEYVKANRSNVYKGSRVSRKCWIYGVPSI